MRVGKHTKKVRALYVKVRDTYFAHRRDAAVEQMSYELLIPTAGNKNRIMHKLHDARR